MHFEVLKLGSILLELLNLVSGKHDWNAETRPICFFLLMLHFVFLCSVVMGGKLVEDYLAHDNRIPILRWLFVGCRDYLNLWWRLHNFYWLRHKVALTELIPCIVLDKTLQVVLHLEKLGADGTSKTVQKQCIFL